MLIYGGILFVAAGLLWPWLSKLPIGRLPGDIVISKPHFKVYIPITTMVLLSILLNIILRLFRK